VLRVREVWSAHVRGDGGRFERARLVVDDAGRFVLETSSAAEGSADRAVIDREDVERLTDALVDEFDPETGPSS
jgi:hypothetical protein